MKAFLAIPFLKELLWVQNAIAAACRELNVDLIRVDEKLIPGTNIVSGIHHFISESDFAFVILTGLNPNVIYEMGLLQALSKPTIVLADKNSASDLPFDLRSITVIKYDADAMDADEIRITAGFAAGRVISMLTDSVIRQQISQGINSFVPPPMITTEMSFGSIDWAGILAEAEKAMGLSRCNRKNLSQLDDLTRKGWKLKARCAGGSTVEVVVDLNGEIQEIDVQ